MTAISILLAGDAHVNRRLSVNTEPHFVELVELARSVDVAFLNAEGTFHDYEPDCYPAAVSGGSYLRSPPFVADELRWMGFQLVSTANNHTLDFGYGGLARTHAALCAAAVTYAGTGWSLADARGPSYVDCAAGRVALVAAASTVSASAIAGVARPDVQGRPGVNPLRFRKWYGVPPEGLDRLRWVARRIGYDHVRQSSSENELYFMGRHYVVHSEEGRHTTPDEADMAGNLEAIRAASRQADWVMFSLHAHEGSRFGLDRPADFVLSFAKKAIDAGAHIVICHGHHGLRGVQLYRRRPIVYGLGSFAFDTELVTRQPAEFYARYGLPPTAGTVADAYDARLSAQTRPGEDGIEAQTNASSWASLVATVAFDGDVLTRFQMHALDLGFGLARARRGRPSVATDELRHRTLASIRSLSAEYQTVVLDDGIVHLG